MSERTFKVDSPHMKGSDIKTWQSDLNKVFARWGWDHQIKEDGDYGISTRSATAEVLYGLGIARTAMKEGVTPRLRSKVRNQDLTATEKKRRQDRKKWRAERKRKYGAKVAAPLSRVSEDSWGWHPGTHDGIDLICDANAPLFAMVRSKVVRADPDGWWGKAPSGDVSKGDGIIILRALETVGPIKKGMNLCYGHAENPRVRSGQVVEAGEFIGNAGLAVAWHIHFMVNMRRDTRGVGDRDPRRVYEYAMKNGR